MIPLVIPTQVTWHLTWSDLSYLFQTIHCAMRGSSSPLQVAIFGGQDTVICQNLQRVWYQSGEDCLASAEEDAPPSLRLQATKPVERLQGFRCRGRSRIYYERRSKPKTPVSQLPGGFSHGNTKVSPAIRNSPELSPPNQNTVYHVQQLTLADAGILMITADFYGWLQVEALDRGESAGHPPVEAPIEHQSIAYTRTGWHVSLVLNPDAIRDRLNFSALQPVVAQGLPSMQAGKDNPALQQFWQRFNALSHPLPPAQQQPQTPPALTTDLTVSLLNRLPIGLFQTSLDGGFLKANATFCRMTGYSEPQLRQLDLQAITPPEEFATELELIQQVVQYQEQRIFETNFRTAKNELIWVEVNLSLVGEPEAEDSYLLGFVTDLRDRRQIEAERLHAAQEIQQRQEREQVLNNLAARIRSTLDLETMLQNAANELQQALKVDRVVVYQIFPDATGCCVAEAVHPGYPHMMGATFGADCVPPPYLEAYGSGRLWSVDDVDTVELSECHLAMLHQMQTRSMIAVGILSMDDTLEPKQRKLWGLLAVHHCETVRQWLPEELQLVQAVANQLTIALEQTKLLNHLTSYTHELEERVSQRTRSLQRSLKFEQFTRSLVECLNRDLDENHLFTRVANDLLTSLDADICLIGLFNPQAACLEIKFEAFGAHAQHHYSLLGLPLAFYDFPPDCQQQFLEGQTFQCEVPLAQTKLIRQAFSHESHSDWLTASLPINHLISPIIGTDHLIGALVVVQLTPRIFEADEVALVKQTTNYCAIALRQAQLYRQEHEQRLSAEYLRSFLEKSIDVFVEYDPQLRYISVNPSGCALLELPREAIIGKTNRELLGNTAETIEHLIQQAIHTTEKVFVDHEIQLPQGIRVFETVYAPITDPNGTVQRIIAVSRDVTEFKHQWQLLEHQNQQLAETTRLKQEFVATTSHELRTPLTAILGFSNVLLQEFFGELNPKQRDYLERIHLSGQHLLDLINDILDLSRLEAGRMELDLQAVYIVDICEGVVSLIQERAAEQGLALEVELDPDVEWITADPRRLKQMLLNLLANAVKFTAEGTVGLRVYRQQRSAKYAGYGADCAQQAIATIRDVIHFQVWDTGIGIDEVDQRLLFAPFSQIDNSLSRRHQGTGLGLVITRKLAELHGGWITLESTPGKGSTFTLSLPLQLTL